VVLQHLGHGMLKKCSLLANSCANFQSHGGAGPSEAHNTPGTVNGPCAPDIRRPGHEYRSELRTNELESNSSTSGADGFHFRRDTNRRHTQPRFDCRVRPRCGSRMNR
jgi:hypothetical protein